MIVRTARGGTHDHYYAFLLFTNLPELITVILFLRCENSRKPPAVVHNNITFCHSQCLQAVLIFFNINFPFFQYFACLFSILLSALYIMYVLSLLIFFKYLCSEFSIQANPYTWRLCTQTYLMFF